jgi:hypothetical protein
MTSTRDPQASRAAAIDQPDTDDTAGFSGINTTRSNIKNSLGVSLSPSLGVLRLLPLVGGAGIALPEIGSQFGIKENGVR